MSNIKKLSEYQHSRLRTEMYLGSRSPHSQEVIVYDEDFRPHLKELTWVPALYTAFREILDNACDEIIGHAYGNRIDIEYDENNLEFSIKDNGRGIPIDWDKDNKTYAATLALSHARAGRNFEERGQEAGTNGIGGATVNFCSEWFKVEIYRDGKKFTQEFLEGDINKKDELIIKDPKIIDIKNENTGTKISCRLSKYVFETVPKLKNNMILPEEFIKSRVTELAICNPLVKIYYKGERIKVRPKPEQNLFDKNVMNFEIKDGSFCSKFYLVPNWESDGEFVHSIVNNIPAFNGGSHIEGFKRTFYRTLLQNLQRESKRRKLSPNNSDIQKNLLVYNITTMDAPDFDSQSKTRLINEYCNTVVKKYLEDEEFYKKLVKKHKEWIEEIYQRCAVRTQKKDQAELSKLAKRNLRNKIPKLRDAIGKDRNKCILMLAEGDSAIGGMASVRNAEIHAGMPLRGKVLNVHGQTPKKVIENNELADIMNAVGLIIGQPADRSALNYGKIYIAADMDPDGANITALLINFFHKYWPELFDAEQEPFIYIFQTPFVICEKGKQRDYWYAHNYDQFDPKQYKGWEITRAKGLGTLTKDDWQHSLNNPVAIPVIDDENLGEVLDLLFNGKRADDRKEWMGI